MRIVGPEDVKQQYKEYLQSVLRNYEVWQQEKNYSERSEKSFSIIVLHGILNTEMNDMQNRILCVKCSVNGELSLKRKVRLTVYYPHPLQTI